LRSSGAIPNLSGINCPNDLPLPATLTDLSIALTYTLAVSAIRKGNAASGTPRISYVSASHVRGPRSATILFSDLIFLSCGYRELILRLARTPESRGYGTPSGVSDPLGSLASFPSYRTDVARDPNSPCVSRRLTVRPALRNSAPRGIDRRIGFCAGHVLARSCLRPHASRRPAHHHLATEGHPNEEAASHSI
jgi:hypothetical protein